MNDYTYMREENPMFEITNRQEKERLGEIVVNKQGEEMQIIRYGNATDIDIKFLDTNNVVYNQAYSNFKRGTTKDYYLPTLFGHGIIGSKAGSAIKDQAYSYWNGLLKRCYSKVDLKRYPTYEDCSVCDEWKYLENFIYWFNDNYYECENETMCLDKDILIKNNKTYSPDSCIFVPERINILFTKTNKTRGEYPIGVYYKKKNKKFVAQVSKVGVDGKKQQEHLGLYDTVEEAFEVYKKEKERYIKEIADCYKIKYNNFPKELYDALYRYEVKITD